jgi:hypothetical protein
MVNLRKKISKRSSLTNNTKSKKYNRKIIHGRGIPPVVQTPPVYYTSSDPPPLTEQELLNLRIEDQLTKSDQDLFKIRNELFGIINKKVRDIVDKKIELYTLLDSNAAKKFFNRNEIKALEQLLVRLENELKPLEDNCFKKVAVITNEIDKRENSSLTPAEKNNIVSNWCSSEKEPLTKQFMRDHHIRHTKLNLYNKYNPTKTVQITKNEPVIVKTN